MREVAGTVALIWADPLSALIIIDPHDRKSNDMGRVPLALVYAYWFPSQAPLRLNRLLQGTLFFDNPVF